MLNHRYIRFPRFAGYGRMMSALLYLVLACTAASAEGGRQTRTLTGQVVDVSGDPVPHIEIRLEGFGSARKTETNIFGQFQFFDVTRQGSWLVIEAVGYQAVREPITTVGFSSPTQIVLPRLWHASRFNRSAAAHPVIDVTQMLGNFPGEAVEEYEKGLRAKEKNKTDLAIAHLEKAVFLAPDFGDAHINLGVLYHGLDRLREAEQEYLHARHLTKNHAQPLINLGGIYLKEGKNEAAIQVLREAISITPPSALAFYNLGIALYRTNKLAEAEESLLRARALGALDPRLARVRLMLANIYLLRQDRDRLLEQLVAYLEENPEGQDRPKVLQMRSTILGIN